jgi:hypothetical protein
MDGVAVGIDEGEKGLLVGTRVGDVGEDVGNRVGCVGTKVGTLVGFLLGKEDGMILGKLRWGACWYT